MFRPAPSWSQLDPQQERDVRELIRHVAGLQDEADPNFQLALHFAWSNFRCGVRLRGRGWEQEWVKGYPGARPGFRPSCALPLQQLGALVSFGSLSRVTNA